MNGAASSASIGLMKTVSNSIRKGPEVFGEHGLTRNHVTAGAAKHPRPGLAIETTVFIDQNNSILVRSIGGFARRQQPYVDARCFQRKC